MDKKKQNVVLDWMRKIHLLEHAHRLESIQWKKRNNWLGIPSLIIASLIAPIGGIDALKGCFLMNLISILGGVLVAILVGLQTFLKPSEIAEKHRQTSNTFEKLRHKLEYIFEFAGDNEIDAEIDKIRTQWEKIDQLNVSQSNFKKAAEWIDKSNKYPAVFTLKGDS
jgi:uncharacterized membrane protein YgaE (UPF0421/DUF939 family)